MSEFAGELVLPVVVRIERDGPPARTDALEGAARAVLSILTDGRPEWADGLDGTQGSAQLRVYPPVPVDTWPSELSRLQVGGTNLADLEPPEPTSPDLPLVLLSP